MTAAAKPAPVATLGDLALGTIATVSWAGVERVCMVTGTGKGWKTVWARIRYAGVWTDPWPLHATTPVLKVSQLEEV